MEGLLLLCAKMGRAAAVEIPFCERTIYNLVIDLFMCLHRLSLDATGHVWEANVFMALFLISQAIFFPTAFCFYGVQTDAPRSAFLKNCIRFINVWSAHICCQVRCSFSRMTRGRCFNFLHNLTSSYTQQQQQQQLSAALSTCTA